MRKLLVLLPIGAAVIAIGAISAIGAGAHGDHGTVHRVNVPLSDRFVPFGLTVQVGDRVDGSTTTRTIDGGQRRRVDTAATRALIGSSPPTVATSPYGSRTPTPSCITAASMPS